MRREQLDFGGGGNTLEGDLALPDDTLTATEMKTNPCECDLSRPRPPAESLAGDRWLATGTFLRVSAGAENV